MTKETLDYALSVLSAQNSHTRRAYARKASKLERARQEAYADGIRDALEIILTEGYTVPLSEEFKLSFARGCYHV